jgi:hypothetical protein
MPFLMMVMTLRVVLTVVMGVMPSNTSDQHHQQRKTSKPPA